MRGDKIFQKISPENPTILLDEKALLGDETEFTPMRKKELDEIADAIRPLLANRKGENLFICGPIGSGKRSLMKYVLSMLPKETARVLPVYVNCWEFPTPMAVYSRILESMSIFMPRRGLATDEVFARILAEIDNANLSVLLVLDNVQGLLVRGEEDIFHSISRANSGRARFNIICMSADKNALARLSAQARLSNDFTKLEFEAYSEKQLVGILAEKAKKALAPDSYSIEILEACALLGKADGGNAELALEILKRSAKLAEKKGNAIISIADVELASSKSDYVQSLIEGGDRNMLGLTNEEKAALKIIAENVEIDSTKLYEKFLPEKCVSRRQLRNYLCQLGIKGLVTERPGRMNGKLFRLAGVG